MINRYGTRVELVCNECGGTSADEDQDDFEIMIEDAKRDGWVFSKAGRNWKHICPDCRE